MGRKRINEAYTMARYSAAMLDDMRELLDEKEKLSQFIRKAIAAEIKRRWRARAKKK